MQPGLPHAGGSRQLSSIQVQTISEDDEWDESSPGRHAVPGPDDYSERSPGGRMTFSGDHASTGPAGFAQHCTGGE